MKLDTAPSFCHGSQCSMKWALSQSTTTKGTLLGTPNREPQEYSRNIMEYKDLGRYIPIIYLKYFTLNPKYLGFPVESL